MTVIGYFEKIGLKLGFEFLKRGSLLHMVKKSVQYSGSGDQEGSEKTSVLVLVVGCSMRILAHISLGCLLLEYRSQRESGMRSLSAL